MFDCCQSWNKLTEWQPSRLCIPTGTLEKQMHWDLWAGLKILVADSGVILAKLLLVFSWLVQTQLHIATPEAEYLPHCAFGCLLAWMHLLIGQHSNPSMDTVLGGFDQKCKCPPDTSMDSVQASGCTLDLDYSQITGCNPSRMLCRLIVFNTISNSYY